MKVAIFLFFALVLVIPAAGQVSDSVVVDKETKIDMHSPQRLAYDYYRLMSLQLMLEQWRRLAEQYACDERKWLQHCVPLEELEKLEQKKEKKGE